MDQMHAGLLLLLLCSAYSYQFRRGAGYGPFVPDPEREWKRMETVIAEEMAEALTQENKFLRSASGSGSETPEAKKVPEYVVVSSSEDQKEVFRPEKGARPLPDKAKEILLRTAAPSVVTVKPRPQLVEILCHVDRIYVRVIRAIFKSKDSYKHLKLGTCPVNQGTKKHFYLLYLLKTDCGFKKENMVDYRSVGNGLTFKPPGVVVREMPFSVPLLCKYPRFFHSYKVGFYPLIRGGTVLQLNPKGTFTLTPQDASGNEITGGKTYTLGEPMYFEAKLPDSSSNSENKRIYINKCYMTPSQDPNSTPKYVFIDNYGCMIDGKMTDQSKFIAGSSKTSQKFTVTAVIFRDSLTSSSSSSKQLYMHCDISMGELTPTETAKACNYNSATKKWVPLFGDASACKCCASTCPTGQSNKAASETMISSHSWKVDLGSMDRLDKAGPRMKSFDADEFSLEDPDMAEHKDFLKYWED